MVINLLPPKIKQEKKTKKMVNMIVLFLTVVFLILVILVGGVLAANFYTKNDLKKTEAKIADQNSLILRYKDIEDNINNINLKLAKISAASTQKILWSNVLIEISNDTPSMVQIKSVTLNQTGNKIDLSGYAETRSDIAKFKEKLENSKFFKNVTFSSSVHDQEQANFSFNISCELKEGVK